MASLLTIPLELLVSISSFLPTSDLAALRLTCKQVEKSLYEWFSSEFFTKKQFMLTHASLQTLVDISKHVSFSKKLSHVIIATNVYDAIPLRFRDGDAAARYLQGYEDQRALMDTGMDREMLTEAFQNLVNLRTVGLRDFDAPSRVRDGDHASWSAWGASTVYRETGVQLRFSQHRALNTEIEGRFARFVSRAFSVLIHALGKANRTPPCIEVLLRQNGLPDTAFSIPEFIRPTAEPVLAHVKTLLLSVDLDKRLIHTHNNGIAADPNAGRSLRHFLGATPNLTHLRLNFQKHLVTYNEGFLEWLGQTTPPLGPQLAPFLEPAPIALQSLKQLDLGQLNVRPDVIVAIVTKFAPTLEELSLWRMGFHSLAPPPFGHKPNLWADFFARLSRVPQLDLKSLKVGMLQQDHMYVNFKVEDDEKAPPLKVKEYTGKEMQKFLKELLEQVVVAWPEPILQDDENSDEDEEMADEGEEDDEDLEDGDDDDSDDDE